MAVFDTSATTTANGIVFDFAVATLQAIPTTVDVGQSIMLSIDEDRPGATVTYFANDVELSAVTGGNGYQHEWVTDTAGSYTVRAEITDADGRQHRTQIEVVLVESEVPQGDEEITVSSSTIQEGESVTVSLQGLAAGETVQYVYPPTGLPYSEEDGTNTFEVAPYEAAFVFVDAGTYDIQGSWNDGQALSQITTITVT